MEYATGRPTLGDGDSERRLLPAALWDRPLYLRPGVELHVREHAPIAVKRHGLQDISFYDRLIWITRDPIEVLIRSGVDLDDDAFSRSIPEEARAWKWQVRVFDAWRPEYRLSLRFEDLASADPEPFCRLAAFIGVSEPATVVRGFLEQAWADSYDVLQDRPLSRDQASNYWQRSYPERASQVRKALLAPEVLQPSRLSEWVDP